MRIPKMLIYCIKLDHALYLINYSTFVACMVVHKLLELGIYVIRLKREVHMSTPTPPAYGPV